MKIKLQNFSCFSKKTIIIDEFKSTLITGINGVGKSSLLDSIVFALYDKIKMPIMFSKKQCTVSIKFEDGTKVKRSKGKQNSLVFKQNNRILSDINAQSAIDQFFGDYNTYIACSYIKQGKKHPLFEWTTKDRIKLLRNIALSEDTIDSIRSKLSLKMKKHKSKLDERNIVKIRNDTIISQYKKNNANIISRLESLKEQN